MNGRTFSNNPRNREKATTANLSSLAVLSLPSTDYKLKAQSNATRLVVGIAKTDHIISPHFASLRWLQPLDSWTW